MQTFATLLQTERMMRQRRHPEITLIAFEKVGITGVGWQTFRHTAGTVLAELGEHQLTIPDYLRHANLSVTNKHLEASLNMKRNAQASLVQAILPVHLKPGKTAEAVAPRFQECHSVND